MIDHAPAAPHGDDPLRKMDAYWRAANYLSVGQIELLDNLLLKEPLRREHVKHRLLGHWRTTPALNFIYVHLNRVIRQCDLNVLYVTGPGHGGPGIVANVYLEGTNTEVYSEITRDRAGHGRRRGGGRARRDGARGEPVRDRPADAGRGLSGPGRGTARPSPLLPARRPGLPTGCRAVGEARGDALPAGRP